MSSTRPLNSIATPGPRHLAQRDYVPLLQRPLLPAKGGEPTLPTAPAPTTALENPSTPRLALPGSLSTPKIELRLNELLKKAQNGCVTMRVPLFAEKKIGNATVRPGTFARLDFTVENDENVDEEGVQISGPGRIVRQRCHLRFESYDGKAMDLDGPFIWNPKSVYIDEEGRLRADVPCFPDPDITRDVFKIDTLPFEVGPLVELLKGLAGNSRLFRLSEQRMEGFVDGEGAHSTLASSEKPRPQPEVRFANELVDWLGMELAFEGELAGGLVHFGPHASLNLEPGSKISGTSIRDTLKIHVAPRFSSDSRQSPGLFMASNGTVLKAHGGNAVLDFVQAPRDDVHGILSSFRISELSTDSLYIETPAQGAKKHVLSMRGVELHGGNTIDYTRDKNSQEWLRLHLPDIRCRELKSTMHVKDAEGKGADLEINSGSPEGAPFNAALKLDDQRGTFALSGHFDAFSGRLPPTAIGNNDDLGLNLGGDFSGPIDLHIERDNTHGRVRIKSSGLRAKSQSAIKRQKSTVKNPESGGTKSEIRIEAAQLLSSISESTLRLRIPHGILKAEFGDYENKPGLIDVGHEWKIQLANTGGAMLPALKIQRGQIVAQESRINLEPPWQVQLFARAWPSLGMAQTTVRARLLGFRLLADPETGELLPWPDFELEGTLAGFLHKTPLDRMLKKKISTALCTALFDKPYVPANLSTFVRLLKPRLPVLSQEITTSSPNTTVSTTHPLAAAIFQSVRWPALSFVDAADIRMKNAEIKLADGRRLELNEGTRWRLRGTLNDLHVQGYVKVSGAAEGDIDLDLHIRGNVDGDLSFDLRLPDQSRALPSGATVQTRDLRVRGSANLNSAAGNDTIKVQNDALISGTFNWSLN